MQGKPALTQQPFDLWLEFEHWVQWDRNDAEENFFNMKITLPGGKTYALNVWTFRYLSRAVRECEEAGEHLRGAYLPTPDLLVQQLDRVLIERVVTDLIAHGGMKPE